MGGHSSAGTNPVSHSAILTVDRAFVSEAPPSRHKLFHVAFLVINILLLFSLIGVVWAGIWEYSTQRYVQGFSDAIVPVSAAPEQKVQSILNWMAHTPQRFGKAPPFMDDDRDPADTLNYSSLLGVCGTATNAFINLANSSGLTVRRLLLLGPNRGTVHVVAEVLINGRWIVVDPVFHNIFRGTDGEMLTSSQLTNPAVFHAATQNIDGYDPSYVFDRAVHVRLAHFGPLGRWMRQTWGVPSWEGLPLVTLITERESLEVTILFVIVALFLLIVRIALRWYGKARHGIRTEPIYRKLLRIGGQLFESGG